jgi:hypothetical protein
MTSTLFPKPRLLTKNIQNPWRDWAAKIRLGLGTQEIFVVGPKADLTAAKTTHI